MLIPGLLHGGAGGPPLPPEYIASTSMSNGDNNLYSSRSIAIPTHIAGDLCVLCHHALTTSGSFSTGVPSGWSFLIENAVQNTDAETGTTTYQRYTVFYRILGPSEPGSVTITTSRTTRRTAIASSIRRGKTLTASYNTANTNPSAFWYVHIYSGSLFGGTPDAPDGYTLAATDFRTSLGISVARSAAYYKSAFSAAENPLTQTRHIIGIT